MSGGTWTTQNKVRPGVYVNFKGEPKAIGALGERGTVTMALPLSWGPHHEIITLEAGENTLEKLGYPITASQLLLVKEALKRAKTLLLYRLNQGTAATAPLGELTVTARHGGVRGNDVTLVVEKLVDEPETFLVKTLVEGNEVDAQQVANGAALQGNQWVSFSGTGALGETAGVPLTGGSDGTIVNDQYLSYLEAAETLDFDTMALTVADPVLKELFVNFVKRMRDDEGRKLQLVVENYPQADFEGVISVKNGVILESGETLTAVQCTPWVAAAVAAARVNESLTYQAYDGAVDAAPRYSNTQTIEALLKGEWVFTGKNQRAIVEQDINSFTSFAPEKGKAFSKNRVIRVLDSINNDLVQIFTDFYLGKVPNHADGRMLLKNACTNYLGQLQEIQAIQNFDYQTDVVVQMGDEGDSVVIETYVQPVDSVEKLYIQVQVR